MIIAAAFGAFTLLAGILTGVVALTQRGDQIAVDALDTGSTSMSAVTVEGAVDAISDTATGRTNELLAAVYYPSVWPTKALPVVLIQHGGHTVCTSPSEQWPCSTPTDRTPSYLGYQYLAQQLVDTGHVVVSISANATVGSADVEPTPSIFNYYESLLLAANEDATGPLGALLTDRLDLTTISLVGHSRGGDAVAHYAQADPDVTPRIPLDRVVLLAPVLPVDFGSTRTVPTSTVPALIITGTCDGDAGTDGLIYTPAFPNPRSTTITLDGANHNFFNTEWTPGTGVPDSIDDATLVNNPACATDSPTRLTAPEQQSAAASEIVSFLVAPGM